jgi:hypothetical protein
VGVGVVWRMCVAVWLCGCVAVLPCCWRPDLRTGERAMGEGHSQGGSVTGMGAMDL